MEVEKLKEISRGAKQARTGDGNFHIQGPMDMVVLNSDKSFLVKVYPMLLLISTKIECLTLTFKEKIMFNIHCLLVQNVEGCIRKDVLTVLMHALDVVRWITIYIIVHRFLRMMEIIMEGINLIRCTILVRTQKQNIFFALYTLHEQEGSPNLVTVMLFKVFQIYVYDFLTLVLPCLL